MRDERGSSRKEYLKWTDRYSDILKIERRNWMYWDVYDWKADWPWRSDSRNWKRYRYKQWRFK